METIKKILGGLSITVFYVFFGLTWTLGWAYWTWIAIKVGSFGMFFFGILGPFALVAGILGLWSFFAGVPLWLLHMVG